MQVINRFFIGILLLSGLLLITLSCSKEEVEEAAPVVKPVKTMIVGQGASGVRSYPGTVQAADRVELSFRVGGPLIDFPVKEGQKVQKGELLARIDPRDYRIAVDKAEAEFAKADADYKRYQQLYEKEAVSLSDLELRQAQRDVTKSNLDNAKADLSDTYLRAPFSGEIGETYFETGEDIKSKERVLGLHGVDVIEIVINVPENDKAQFDAKRVKSRTITASFAFVTDREFDLTLSEFSAAADPRTQTYKATLSMAQPEGVNIQSGMTAEVHFYPLPSETTPGSSEFVIPAIAVLAGDDDANYVWVVDPTEMTIERTEVKVGSLAGKAEVTILSGLSPGDRIVIAGVTTLRDDMKVRLMEGE